VRAATVFGSGKVGYELRAADGRSLYLRLAGGPAEGALDRSVHAVQKISAASPPAAVAGRIPRPLAEGRVGGARYVLEAMAQGSPPLSMTRRIRDECLEFLVALHSVGRDAGGSSRRGDVRLGAHLDALSSHVPPEQRAFLRSLGRELEKRLSGVPLGASHGDFWNENLMVHRGRLSAVLDWEWAEIEALPMLDLMDLIALSPRRTRALPPGTRFTRIIWPLARAGGDERVREYCMRTGTPSDTRTLEDLAKAYWTVRVARAVKLSSRRRANRRWMEQNVHRPLAELRAAA